MNPYPLALLNHLTVPFKRSTYPPLSAGPRAGGSRTSPQLFTTFSCEGRGLSRVCRGPRLSFPVIRPHDYVGVNCSLRIAGHSSKNDEKYRAISVFNARFLTGWRSPTQSLTLSNSIALIYASKSFWLELRTRKSLLGITSMVRRVVSCRTRRQ